MPEPSFTLIQLRYFAAAAERGSMTAAARDLVVPVGWFTTLAPFELPRLVAAYEQEHPEVRVRVVEEEHAHLKHALRDGRCELSVM